MVDGVMVAEEKTKHYTINTDDNYEESDELEIPELIDTLKLSDKDRKKIAKINQAYFDMIVAERASEGYDDWLDSMQNQFDGVVESILNIKTRFNIHRDVTKSHVKNIVNSIIYSVFNTTPIFSVSSRPDAYNVRDAAVSARKIQQYLAYAHDVKGGNDIILKAPATLCAVSAVLCYVGIIKLKYNPKIKSRKYTETFDGSVIKQAMAGDEILKSLNPQAVIVPDVNDNSDMISYNDGLNRFYQTHPEMPVDRDEKRKYKAYVSQLRKGKKIHIVIEEDQVIDNHPQWEFINNKNFYVAKNTNGYKGLCDAEYIGERRTYSYKDLKYIEDKGLFTNVDEIIGVKDLIDNNEDYSYLTTSYNVMEETLLYKPEDCNKEVKIKVWRYVESNKPDGDNILGAEYYPFYSFDCEYIPHYVTRESANFWETKSVGNDLRPSNIAQDIFINKFLEYIDNYMVDTPIVDESNKSLIEQYIMGELVNGMPWVVEGESKIDFVNNHRTPIDIRAGMSFLELLERDDSKRTGVNEIRTGAESTLDPSAPANKIRYLQEQANQNITPYISVFLESFVLVPSLEIKLYDQISEEPLRFFINPNPDEISEGEGNPFDEVSREDMRASVNFHTEALSTYSEGQNRFAKTMGLLQALFQYFPEIAQNKTARREIAEEIIRAGGTSWENRVSRIYPSEKEQTINEMKLFSQGLEAYRAVKSQEQLESGQPAVINPQDIINAGMQAINQYYMPQLQQQEGKQ